MKTIRESIDKFVKEIMDHQVLRPGRDPLGGDETIWIGSLVSLELDKANGNLTDEEYQEEELFVEKYGYRARS